MTKKKEKKEKSSLSIPNKHLAKLDKVAVVLVVDLDGAPWVASAADVATIRGLNNLVGANNGEGNLALHVQDSA